MVSITASQSKLQDSLHVKVVSLRTHTTFNMLIFLLYLHFNIDFMLLLNPRHKQLRTVMFMTQRGHSQQSLGERFCVRVIPRWLSVSPSTLPGWSIYRPSSCKLFTVWHLILASAKHCCIVVFSARMTTADNITVYNVDRANTMQKWTARYWRECRDSEVYRTAGV